MKNVVIKNIELILKSNKDVPEIMKYGKQLDKEIMKKAKKGTLIILLFLFSSILLFEQVSKLAVINPIYYLIILIISILFFVGFNFIYKTEFKRVKNNLVGIQFKYKCFGIIDILYFIIVTFSLIYFVVMFIVTPAQVSGDSMNDTYQDGDQVLIWHLFYTPSNEDVVVIDVEGNSNISNESVDFIIKRIVASPGDSIKYENEIFFVNDVPIETMSNQEFITMMTDFAGSECYYDNEVIPDNKYIVLGDNRDASADSRSIGLIDESKIIGKSIFRILPLNSIGFPSKDLD